MTWLPGVSKCVTEIGGSDELNLTPARKTVETSSFYPTLRRNGGSQHSVSILASREHPCRKWWVLHVFTIKYIEVSNVSNIFHNCSRWGFPRFPAARPWSFSQPAFRLGAESAGKVCWIYWSEGLETTGNDWKRLETTGKFYDLVWLVCNCSNHDH